MTLDQLCITPAKIETKAEPDGAPLLTYDSALALVGTGRFHHRLLGVCGWANASDAVEIMAASFLMPSTTRELALSESQKGWLAAIVFIGMLLGGWIWGSFADRIGRKRCLIFALLINSLGGLCSALSPSFQTMMGFRLVAGLGVGGSIPVIFTYFIEFFPTKTRGTYMVYLAWFWMVGAVTTAAAAWAILSHNLSFSIAGHIVHSWRFFYMICSLPSMSCALCVSFFPESPRYLLIMNRVQDAKKVLMTMAIKNSAALPSICERIQELGVSLDAGGPAAHASGPQVHEGTIAGRAKRIVQRPFFLFSKQYLSHSIKLALVWFNLSFGYYGLTLWIPEYFKRVNEKAAVYSGISLYGAALVSAASNLPGNIWSLFSVKSIGRVKTLTISIGLSAISVLLVPFSFGSGGATMLMITVFGATSVGAWNALNISTAELYATDVRSSAFGMFAAIGRIGAIAGILVFGEFMTFSSTVPMLVTAIALVVGATASTVLKETKDDTLR